MDQQHASHQDSHQDSSGTPGCIAVLLLIVQVPLEQELHLLGRQLQVCRPLKQRAAMHRGSQKGRPSML